MENQEIHDLLIVADATYSMSDYLASLQTSLPQIISISALTGCFSRIGLLGYRDYCDKTLLEWSGWLEQSSNAKQEEQPDLVSIAKSMEPLGGGDYPEATKTALAKAYEVMRPEAATVILLYTDAPPHLPVNGSLTDRSSNFGPEKNALSEKGSYAGFGPSFVDWVSASKMLRKGEKRAQVFCMLAPSMGWQYAGHYNYLCTLTGGSCISLKDSKPTTISKVTVEVLLAWMGVEKAGTAEAAKDIELPAEMCRYKSIDNIKAIKHEDDPTAEPFFSTTASELNNAKKLISANTTSARINADLLKKYLPKKTIPVTDFAKLWTSNTAYRVIVVEHLTKIIESDVRAMSLNPVFGSLWRAVCNDRKLEAREGLISAFGLQVERIGNADEKAQMKAWLEESYDYTAEVKDIIDGVPEKERFPFVCLDPTMSFVLSGVGDGDEDEANVSITAFRRDELLEIGRSCDYKILRRLGRILTRLTYVEREADMPEHIAATTNDEVPKIPMALASKEHGNQFWRILLHIVVPGTMLSSRPAALLAALSLRLGVEPLAQAADREMLRWCGKWNDPDIPETWNVSCLSLILDADQASRQRQKDLGTTRSGEIPQQKSLLKENDKNLFERLVAFKMLELNLDTTLTAHVGWTPEKTIVPIGPLAVCRSCQYPRSVTIMGRSGKCGNCLFDSYESQSVRDKCINNFVTKEDKESTPATWIECSVRTCRVQYVVYNPKDLNVKPKCHYCRQQAALSAAERKDDPAPWVECLQCLNRIIWPESYRSSSFSKSTFICPPCTSGRKTIMEVETTAKKVSIENTTAWLILDSEKLDLFNNRSLYYTISTVGADLFLRRINLFPPTKEPLTLRGKLIRNPASMVATLQDLISRRRTERALCSLCFSNFHPTTLNPACGRRGCLQRVCRSCLSGWYGLNTAGHIINTAALSCPFCRRKPAARTLAKYGMGVHAVGNLAMAVQDQGHWIYAWCRECGFAKQYMERVCARGMPTEVNGWTCDECREEEVRQRLSDERERVERALRDAQIARNVQAVVDAEGMRETLRKAEAESLKGVKPCPGCGTATQKISGCDHITCTIKGCGTHWCYFCGEGFTERGIYAHMSKAHGGYYGGGEEYDDDYEG